MSMKMYVFNDAKVADKLRSLGFSVIKNNGNGRKQNGKNDQYCVPESPALMEALHTQFDDVVFSVSNVLCF